MDIYEQLRNYERYIGYSFKYNVNNVGDVLGTRTLTIVKLRLNKIETKIICECTLQYSNGRCVNTIIPINKLIEDGRLKELPLKLKYRNIKE